MKASSLQRSWYAVIFGLSNFFYIQVIIFNDDTVIYLGAEKPTVLS